MEKNRKKQEKRKQGKRGYRLHDARIAYSGGTKSIRSIKYPLANVNDSDLKKDVLDAIKNDYKILYGNTNFSDFVEWRKKRQQDNSLPEQPYTILGLWIKTLSLGCAFGKKGALPILAGSLFGCQTDVRAIFDKINDDVKNLLDYNKFAEWFPKDPRDIGQNDKKKQGDEQKVLIYNLAKDEHFEKVENANGNKISQIKSEAKEKLENVASEFVKLRKEYDKNGGNYQELKARVFGIDLNGSSDNEEGDNEKIDLKTELVFACDPNFKIDDLDMTNRTAFFDKLLDYYQNKTDKKSATTFIGIGNSGGMVNAFLRYFPDIFKNDSSISEEIEKQAKIFKWDNGQKEILKKRFNEIAEYTKRIPLPKLISSWAEYRTDFMKALASWYKNRETKQLETIKGLIDLRNATAELKEKSQKDSLVNERFYQDCELLNDYLVKIPDLPKELPPKPKKEEGFVELNKYEQKIRELLVKCKIKREQTDVIFDMQADLRSSLNEFCQANPSFLPDKKKRDDGGTEEKSNKNPLRARLDQKIQNSPLFFGEGNQERFKKAYNAKQNILRQIEVIKTVYGEEILKLQDDVIFESKKVETLARVWDNLNNDRTSVIYGVLSEIQSKLDVDFDERYKDKDGKKKAKLQASYYLSPLAKSKGRLRELPIENTMSLKDILTICNFSDLFDKVKTNFAKQNVIRDFANLSKVMISDLVYTTNELTTEEGRKISINLRNAHSELSGLAAIISKREIISHYMIQATSGSQVYLAKCGDKYGYVFPDLTTDVPKMQNIRISHKSNKFDLHNFQDLSECKDDKEKKEYQNIKKFNDGGYFLEIRTSYYQTQFLDWLFGKHSHEIKKKNKETGKKEGAGEFVGKKCGLDFQGAFSLVEQDWLIDWDGEYPELKRIKYKDPFYHKGNKKVYSKENNRVITVQGFQLNPNPNPKKMIDRSENIKPNRFMGVDVGEYGLAVCVIEVSDGKVKIFDLKEDEEFITSGSHQKLNIAVNDLRAKQVKATFTSADTKIAKIRENTLGYYKARLEDLSIRYQARLSFEMEISGLEFGKNKIKKIYDSIKRGDIFGTTDAEKADNNQAWGNIEQKDGKPKNRHQAVVWGLTPPAAGTSQFCTKCHKWTSLDIADNYETEIATINEDGLATVKIPNIANKQSTDESDEKEVRCYIKGGKVGDKMAGKDLRSAIYKAMRPNMFVDEDKKVLFGGMKIVERTLGEEKFAKLQEKFGAGKSRGNIGVYVCPYVDCHHICDADKQAAFNIAARGYLKDKIDKGLSREILTAEEAKLTFNPIELI
ncbi:MAG: type V CRISPR-associated protein Cas12d [Candidatus Nomurabacteria bacterium]|jgi:hypothetical protein|nr:type V CRISPR-associated protein Cas12d [Candidatus Nomurabacteria bacterium]